MSFTIWGYLHSYINEKRHDPNNTALSEVPCVSPLLICRRCLLWLQTPPTIPQGRAGPNHFRWRLLKLPGKKREKKKNTKNHRVPHSNYFKACLVEKLFLPTLNPLCCTVSPPPPVWISGELQKSLPWDPKKRTLLCFNNSIKSPLSLLFSRVNNPNFFSLPP